MTKKDKQGLDEANLLLEEANALIQVLYDRLYARAGDAWQFRSQIDELAKKSLEFYKEYAPEPPPPPPPNEEPTVGSEEEGGMEEPL